MRGMLNASQNLTNLAPLMEEGISRHPGSEEQQSYTYSYITSQSSTNAPPLPSPPLPSPPLHTCFGVGLVGHYPYTAAVHSCKPHDDVLGVVWHDLKEVSLVDDIIDNVQHVVRLVRGVGNDVIQPWYQPIPALHHHYIIIQPWYQPIPLYIHYIIIQPSLSVYALHHHYIILQPWYQPIIQPWYLYIALHPALVPIYSITSSPGTYI